MIRMTQALACAGALVLITGAAQAQPAQAPAPTAPLLYGNPLNAAQAQAAVDAAEAEARRNGWSLSIAVLEPNGQLAAFKKLDGASYGSIEVAMGKARTAAFFRGPSKVYADMVARGGTSILAVPHMLPAQGGVPIIAGGKVIGAIGISGAQASQDEQAAMAGAKAASEAR